MMRLGGNPKKGIILLADGDWLNMVAVFYVQGGQMRTKW